MTNARTNLQQFTTEHIQELVVNESGNRGRSLLSILLSIVVLLLISSMIVAAIVIINPDIANFNRRHIAREAITLEESVLGDFDARDFDFSWTTGADNSDQLLYEESKNLYLVTLPRSADQFLSKQFQPNITTLVSNSSLLASIKYQGYKLSPSKRFILVWTSRRKQFRHSFTARYYIYDIHLDLITLISTRGRIPGASSATGAGPQSNHYEQLDTASLYLNEQFGDQVSANDELARFQGAEWFSSSGQPGSDSLILLQGNDIYVLNNVAGAGSKLSLVRLTHTGKLNELFNGVPDWLYEEEILGDTPAYQVSPDGQRLAYMVFDDSHVSLMPYTIYGDQIIPRVQRIRYPKAGQPNSYVSVRVIEGLATQAPATATSDDNGTGARTTTITDTKLVLPEDLITQQHYIYRINWLTNDKLALIWTNRVQNESYVLVCGASKTPSATSATSRWTCTKNLHSQAPDGWLDISNDILALDEQHYLALVPKFESNELGNFKHLAKVSLNEPNRIEFLTSGSKDVIAINAIDRSRSLVYYTSTVVGSPGQRQVFSVPLNGTEWRDRQHQLNVAATVPESVCVTCAHHPLECLYNFATMSPSALYYVFQCEGPDVPRTELRTTARRLHTSASDKSSAAITRANAPTMMMRADSSAAPQPLTSGTIIATTQNQPNGPLLYAPSLSSPGHNAPSLITDADHRRADNANDNADTKQTTILAVDSNGPNDPSLLWTIEDNRELRDKLRLDKAMPLSARFKLPIANSSYQADVLLLLPPQLGPTSVFQRATSGAGTSSSSSSSSRPRVRRSASAPNDDDPGLADRSLHEYYTLDTIQEYANQLAPGQQYPMVVSVYAGPGSQKVDFRYNIYFGHYLASSRRTIYAMIDGRGSGFQGTKRLFELYRRLGSVEIQDQLDVVEALTGRLNFIDPSKVATWGWSYGGYAAAMALAQSNQRALNGLQWYAKKIKPIQRAPVQSPPPIGIGSLASALRGAPVQQTAGVGQNSAQPMPSLRGVFECAASVAPVTNWLLYDTAYTERFMGSPWINERFDDLNPGDHAPAGKVRPMELSSVTHKRANQWARLNETSFLFNERSPSAQLTNGQQKTNLLQQQQNQLDSVAKYNASRQNANKNNDDNKFNSMPLQIRGHPNSLSFDLNERYRKSSLLEQIGNIDKKRFLLIHGTADDNVHFQQSIMLMKRLIQRNILFETRLYPDQDHGIANKADKLHLGATLSNFFAECFDMPYF